MTFTSHYVYVTRATVFFLVNFFLNLFLGGLGETNEPLQLPLDTVNLLLRNINEAVNKYYIVKDTTIVFGSFKFQTFPKPKHFIIIFN